MSATSGGVFFMFKCTMCINYDVCTEICQSLQEFMTQQGIYSDDYIRPMVSRSKRRKDDIGRWREIPASHRIYDQFRVKNR